MKRSFNSFLLYAAVLFCSAVAAAGPRKDSVKTTFQTAREWRPTIDNRADAVMVYGVGGNPSDRNGKGMSFEQRVKSWRDRGYVTHFMTGIAWGAYQDYFTGEWDGEWHLDEGQVTVKGDTIWHGHMVPYIVPSENYLEYLKEKHVKRVIDAGISSIFMEEPEFWARAGYSEAFKREWKEYYGFDWRPQHESPENTYLANKLKYYLYYRALNEVFTYAKEYGRSKGMDVKCYVPTHSLVNYSQWQIVSPEASLASLPCVDGYIAQVWTGTSREPNYFNGKAAERVFETAYLEYGSMESMTAPTGRKMFFLTDPIEDRARDWADYKRNYEATFTAQLLYPGIADYEIMPWPERIYEGLYRISPDSDKKDRIPRHYSTQMQVMVNSLNFMPESTNKVTGSRGISILMSNSLMFQRFPTHEGYDDPQLPVLKSKDIAPGRCGYFLDIDRVKKDGPKVLAASGRTYGEQTGKNSYSYTVKSPVNTAGVSRILLPARPASVKVDGREVSDISCWDRSSSTYLLSYENSPEGVSIEFTW